MILVILAGSHYGITPTKPLYNAAPYSLFRTILTQASALGRWLVFVCLKVTVLFDCYHENISYPNLSFTDQSPLEAGLASSRGRAVNIHMRFGFGL